MSHSRPSPCEPLGGQAITRESRLPYVHNPIDGPDVMRGLSSPAPVMVVRATSMLDRYRDLGIIRPGAVIMVDDVRDTSWIRRLSERFL